MLLQLSSNLSHLRDGIRAYDAPVRGRQGLDVPDAVAHGCPDTANVSATATVTSRRWCRETSLEDLLRLLTAYAVRSSLPQPSAVPVFGSSSSASECSSSSSSSAHKIMRDQILSECASFCLGVEAVRASDSAGSSPEYTTSFLTELERSIVSAYSQRSTTPSHKRAVLRSVTHCLVRIVEALSPFTGSIRMDMAPLSGILRAWTAVLGIIASEGAANLADAAAGSSASVVLDRVVKEAVLKVVYACLSTLGYELDSPNTLCSIGLKASALRLHPKSDFPQGTASTSADSSARTDVGDGSMNTDSCDKDSTLHSDSLSSKSPDPDPDVKYSIVVYFLSVLSSYSDLMPSTDPLAPAEEYYLNSMVSAVFVSLLSSCQCKQSLRDRAVETPSYSCSYSLLGDADSSLSHRPSVKEINPTTSIPVFQDVFPLIETLLRDEPRIIRTVLRVISYAEHAKGIQQILRKIEVSSACTEGSECDISDAQLYSEHCTVTPFLYLLYRLARSSLLGADTVTRLCGGSWEPLRELCQRAQATFQQFETQEKKESTNGDSPLSNMVDITPRLLAYFHVSGDLGGLGTDSSGGLLIQILYGALQHERTCEVARQYVHLLENNTAMKTTHAHAYCAADEHSEDLSGYFSSPLNAECSSSSGSVFGSEGMQVDGTDSSAAGPGTTELLHPSSSSAPRGPSDGGGLTHPREGDRLPEGSDAPGWDLGSMFMAVLRYKLSCPVGCTLKASVPIPYSLIPASEEELEAIIAAVSSLTRETVNSSIAN
jgi:hypothetical protein